MVTPRVMANSRNSRPTTSPMKRSGISTAMSETVRDRMVKPICCGAFEGGLERVVALLDIAGDIFDHDDGVIDHKAGGNGEGHQRKVVQAEAQQVHDPEGAHQGQRHGNAGDDGGGQVPQEQEDDQHHQSDGQHQLELHILDRGADGRGPVGQYGDLDGGGQRCLAAAACSFLMRSTTSMTLAPGCRWMLTITAGVSFIQAACFTFSASSMTSATSESLTGAPLR